MLNRRALYAAMAAASLSFGQRVAAESAAAILDYPHICKATIAAVMGRPPESITARSEGAITFLSYVRKDDGSLWKYRCKVEGTAVLWASEPGGRWRDDPADERITYHIAEGPPPSVEIVQSFSDGSDIRKTYTAAQLGAKAAK